MGIARSIFAGMSGQACPLGRQIIAFMGFVIALSPRVLHLVCLLG